LCKDIDILYAGMEAVGYGDVDEAVFPTYRNSRFGTVHSKRI
jgi:hypothetical protein